MVAKDLSKEYVNARARAARWIHERQKYAQWWGWAVLTKHNTDPATLGLDDTVAFSIFTDLSQRGLFVPLVQQGQPVVALNLGDPDAWDEVMNPPGWFRTWVAEPLGFVLDRLTLLVFWLASIAITAAVTAVVTKAVG